MYHGASASLIWDIVKLEDQNVTLVVWEAVTYLSSCPRRSSTLQTQMPETQIHLSVMKYINKLMSQHLKLNIWKFLYTAVLSQKGLSKGVTFWIQRSKLKAKIHFLKPKSKSWPLVIMDRLPFLNYGVQLNSWYWNLICLQSQTESSMHPLFYSDYHKCIVEPLWRFWTRPCKTFGYLVPFLSALLSLQSLMMKTAITSQQALLSQ